MVDDDEAHIQRSLAALDRLVALGQDLARRYPRPDDGLTVAEWIKRDRERRTDQILAAVTGVGRTGEGPSADARDR